MASPSEAPPPQQQQQGPYDFDAPQYFDFGRAGAEEEEQENAPPLVAAADNKQPAGLSISTRGGPGVDAGMGVAALQKGVAALALVGAPSSVVEDQEPQRPVPVSKGPWDFDAPMWSDLGATPQPQAPPPPQPAVPTPPAAPAPITTTKARGATTPTRSGVAAASSPKPTTPGVRRGSSPAPSSARRGTTAAAPASPKAGRSPSPSPVPAGATAGVRRVGVATVTAPSSSAVAATTTSPAAPAKSVRAAPAAVRSGRNLLAPTASSAARTFVNRPRKEAGAAGAAATPVQHHSYLAHTGASQAKRAATTTQAVHAMASFLRPTAASWKRTHKDPATEAAPGGIPKPPASSFGYSRGAGPVRATGGMMRPAAASASAAVKKAAVVRGGAAVESTEERELRLAQEARERLRKQVRANRLAYERNRVVGSSTAAAPLRSTKALTIPQSPHLRLQDRHGEKHVSCRGGATHEGEEDEEGIPGVQLFYKPRAPTPTTTGPKALTIPVAPKFQTDSRASRRAPSPRGAGGGEGFLRSDAASSKGQGLTLREYLVAPGAFPGPAPKPPSPRGLTVPESPHLSTRQRAAARRPLQEAAAAAAAEAELAALRQQALFKAKPVDPRVLHSNGEMGVPKVAKSDVTQPQPFHFKTEARGQVHKMAFEARVAEEAEKERLGHEVHAQPLPASSAGGHHHHSHSPQQGPRPLTEPEPFLLASERRHQEAQAQFQKRVQQQREEEERQHRVRARQLPASTFQRTFELRPSEHAPVLPAAAPRLASTARAGERQKFEEAVAQREAAKQRAEAAKAAERRRAQEAEEKRLRQTPVEEGGYQFTARPITYESALGVARRVSSAAAAPSARELTVPISPKLQTAARSHVRPQHHE